MNAWACDFETTTDPDDCRVWAWGAYNIYNEVFEWGKDIKSFLSFVSKNSGDFWFHNLAWDGEFILSYLLQNGFVWSKNKPGKKEFSTTISDKNQFYEIRVCLGGRTKFFHDSYKIIPYSIEDIGKQLGDIDKLEMDYNKVRPVGYDPDHIELEYLKHDVVIQGRAMKAMFELGGTKITIGSNALHNYKSSVGKYYKYWFPPPKYDADIRQAYKGGFVYLNAPFAGKQVGDGIVLDVNSLYPYVMRERDLPYGEGVFFEGKYEPDPVYPLYIIMFRCGFDLKEGHLPTVQMKNNLSFVPTEYIKNSNGEVVTMCMTSVDFKLFMDHYDTYDMEFFSGYKFKSAKGMFNGYIDSWIAKKIYYEKRGNLMMRTICKLFLNNLYGKFSTNPEVYSKIPTGIDEKGKVIYQMSDKEERTPVYLPVGAFITAWARDYTIRAAQANYDRFLYADTDSLHLLGTELPDNLRIDPYELGAWKHELTFKRAKYLRAKSYVEETEEKLKITCAGLPKSSYEYVTFDNFEKGTEYQGKKTKKRVAGGVILVDTTFKIKS